MTDPIKIDKIAKFDVEEADFSIELSPLKRIKNIFVRAFSGIFLRK